MNCRNRKTGARPLIRRRSLVDALARFVLRTERRRIKRLAEDGRRTAILYRAGVAGA